MRYNFWKSGKKGERTFFFSGQAPVTPNEEDPEWPKTICCGYGYGKDRHYCKEILVALTGVLEPRCPECYKQHLKLSKEVSKVDG